MGGRAAVRDAGTCWSSRPQPSSAGPAAAPRSACRGALLQRMWESWSSSIREVAAMVNADSSMPWVISADDHVVEPPHLWEQWLPAKYRDRGPRVEPGPTMQVPRAGGIDY